jgi:hypothetical protein
MHPPVEKTGLAFGVGIPDDVGNFDVDAIVPLTTTAYDAPDATHGIAMGGKVISLGIHLILHTKHPGQHEND